MSKLSDGLKALINASHAKPHLTKPPANIKSIFSEFAKDAQRKNVGLPAWVTISTAASMTMNCPEAMSCLLDVTREVSPSSNPTTTVELMREVGLKCISFNGIPRSINCLGAFHSSLDPEIRSSLVSKPSRQYEPANIDDRLKTGRGLWDSVYHGLEDKLLTKLGHSHPDLPVHILHGHYSSLLADPAKQTIPQEAKVGRVLTSLVAVTCLRSQTGVGPQVTSHIFGLRKAYEQGDADADGENQIEGGKWLASEDGNRWLLESIDRLVDAIGGGKGTTFAPGLRAKL